jgi:hypothetical protein
MAALISSHNIRKETEWSQNRTKLNAANMLPSGKTKSLLVHSVKESSILDLLSAGVEFKFFAVYFRNDIPFLDYNVKINTELVYTQLSHHPDNQDNVKYFVKEYHAKEYYFSLMKDLYIVISPIMVKYEELKDEYPEEFI